MRNANTRAAGGAHTDYSTAPCWQQAAFYYNTVEDDRARVDA